MRIVIDLQSCQQGHAGADALLALVRQMAACRREHTLWLAFSRQAGGNIAALRAAFDGVLPARQMVVYDTPAPDGGARTARMIALIRDHFFANLDADLVFVPGWFDHGASRLGAPGGPLARHAYAVTVADAAASELDDMRPALERVDLVLAMSSQAAAALRTAVTAARVCEIGAAAPQAAHRLWDAIEEAGRHRTAPPPAHPVRPRLAWVAPLQPARDGMDGQADALQCALAQHYDIHLVVPDPGAAGPGSPPLPLHDPAWFVLNASSFDRIVYQFGNSQAHGFIADLLARHTGTVILDDFFLGKAIDGSDRADAAPRALQRALYHSHGYRAVARYAITGARAAIEEYPANKAVLDRATGVIARTPSLVALADAWYGPGSSAYWHVLPTSANDAGELARMYAAAIEKLAAHSPAGHYRTLLRELSALGLGTDPRQPELVAAARAIAANGWPLRPRQLLVDVSAMAQLDMKTGISRVVRSILLCLLDDPPPGYRVEPVYADGTGGRYRYARQFGFALCGADGPELDDAPIEHQPGDIFLGLDLSPSTTTQNAALLAEMREHGMHVCFVLYDMLPLLQKEAFAYGSSEYFERYLETITRQADGVVCISRAVADELYNWATAHPPSRPSPLHISYFHLGADLAASTPSTGLVANAESVFSQVAQRPTLLMVGTVEPRKGHEQALAACELLWSRNVDVNLVIVGKPGWLVERLIRKLDNHPRLGKQLFWFPSASDEMLTKLYESCSALLAASSGEGFGLPLIEAARYGLPIIARDLPVFHEVSGEHAFYFRGHEARDLAQAIGAWLALQKAGQAPQSTGMPWLSWAGSARQLLAAVVEGKRYLTVGTAPEVRS